MRAAPPLGTPRPRLPQLLAAPAAVLPRPPRPRASYRARTGRTPVPPALRSGGNPENALDPETNTHENHMMHYG